MNDELPDSSQRARKIFDEALNLSPPGRAAFVERECGDDQKLRASVEALLISHKESVLFEKIAAGIRLPLQVSQKTGDLIDDFLLLEKMPEGGGGVVFKAKENEPIPRHVALKIIKQDLANEQAVKRVEAEIKVLASLEHSYIARVYHAGKTKDGLPYFTMELIDGKSITEYADTFSLTIPERIELFVKVCKGVKHAHKKGFIHLDIKPKNILVFEEGGEHVPKVIDFGVAKAINENEFAFGFVADADKIGGTLAYMSPEQVSIETEEVDFRSDIYSLGLVLYELLVGSPPFDFTGMTRDEVAETILKKMPELPSSRINTEADNSYFDIANRRRTDPIQLKNILKGDLDRIVMKCLEKDSRKRFRSVAELIVVLQNFLAQRKSGTTRNPNTKLILSILAIGILVVVLVESYIKIRPDFSTPEGFVKIMCNPKARAKYDREIINRSTTKGFEVWEFLKTNSFYLEKGIGNIEEYPINGRRRELKMKYTSSEGNDEISVIFFVETNILKFHDVFIYTWEGSLYSNYLSAKIDDPVGFEEKTRRLNPETSTVFRSNSSTNSSTQQKITP